MTATRRIYLDNAATSWPKPEAVYWAVDHYAREVGAPAGRSAYTEAIEVQQAVRDARVALARFIGAGDPSRVVFTSSGTDSLNLAIQGLVRRGDHVVTSTIEHNSVLRPLRHLEETRGVEVTRVACDGEAIVDPDAIRAALRPNTRLVVLTHASNVTGSLQPIAEVGRIVREHEAFFLVDAAQTLGHMPLAVDALAADLIAAPGHKGLLGPLGTGLVYIAAGVEQQLASLRQGGTGTESHDDREPDTLPEKYEVGNLNVPGILGLAAGVAYLSERSLEQVRDHSRELTSQLLDGLSGIAGLRVYGPMDAGRRVAVVSIQLEGYDPQEIAATLDAAFGVQVRAGFHCAALVHRELGTAESGGTVRLSPGPFTTAADVEATISAVHQIASTSLTI